MIIVQFGGMIVGQIQQNRIKTYRPAFLAFVNLGYWGCSLVQARHLVPWLGLISWRAANFGAIIFVRVVEDARTFREFGGTKLIPAR